MKNSRFTVVIIALIAALAAGVLYWKTRMQPQEQVTALPEIVPAQPRTEEPVIQFPVPEPAEVAPGSEPEKPLPPLMKSDQTIGEALAELLEGIDLQKLLHLDNFIPRFVLMVDTLPHQNLPIAHIPVQLPKGSFQVSGEEDDEVIASANYRRYQPYVALAEKLDAKRATDIYFHFYPLFQKAYEKMGYPSRYFNDRLVEVIDHLLAAPEIQGPVRLKKHIVRYQFADPRLEALSAGQKIMIRIGPTNAEAIKAKLRELRIAVTRGSERQGEQ